MKIVETLKNYVRVLKIAKKPSLDDFKDTARICLIVMAAIGVVGFLLYMLFVMFPI